MKNITIIGLGLIGGSIAYGLKGYGNISGFDKNKAVLEKALEQGAITKFYHNEKEAVSQADIVILCIYPNGISKFIKENAAYMKTGAILTDVCGVKTTLYEQIKSDLPKNIDYVGIHPMAGKEVDGFENADAAIFKDTGFLIIPMEETKDSNIDEMKSLATHLGATKIATVSANEHDDIIAYTSDLMHISAACLCMDYHQNMSKAFTAGAYRDCTRIAKINPQLWTELLLTNKNYIENHLKKYINNLNEVLNALNDNDSEKLYKLLERSNNNKELMLKK